jgi:hypothetical protein
MVLFEHKTLKQLFSSFQHDLKLEIFQFQLHQLALRQDAIYDQDWEIFGVTTRKIRDRWYARHCAVTVELLEIFVLGKCSWPIQEACPVRHGLFVGETKGLG